MFTNIDKKYVARNNNSQNNPNQRYNFKRSTTSKEDMAVQQDPELNSAAATAISNTESKPWSDLLLEFQNALTDVPVRE